MAGALLLEVVTPEGRKLHEQVDELTAPSVGGEFGVLPGHLPILAALRTGILTYRQGTTTGACAVGGGFIEVSETHAYVLTDRYINRSDVDPVRVRADLKTVDSKIEKHPGPPTKADFLALVADELWCAAQLELHGDPPPPTVNFVAAYGQAPENEDSLTEGGSTAVPSDELALPG
jgi:F-type H+-transporting ATPase subunit epsilon